MKIYLFIAIILVGIAVLVFMRGENRARIEPAQSPQLPATSVRALETQTNDEGPVTVTITPRISSEIAFEIILDTHSGELNADLTQVATLTDENGKTYKPARWEGDPPGGHHRTGILSFDPIAPIPKTLRLVVQQIGGIAEREFLWLID